LRYDTEGLECAKVCVFSRQVRTRLTEKFAPACLDWVTDSDRFGNPPGFDSGHTGAEEREKHYGTEQTHNDKPFEHQIM